MNVLVTGCAGFIGSKVGELLIQNGHHVVGVDNFNNSYDIRLKEWRHSQLQGTPISSSAAGILSIDRFLKSYFGTLLLMR